MTIRAKKYETVFVDENMMEPDSVRMLEDLPENVTLEKDILIGFGVRQRATFCVFGKEIWCNGVRC